MDQMDHVNHMVEMDHVHHIELLQEIRESLEAKLTIWTINLKGQ